MRTPSVVEARSLPIPAATRRKSHPKPAPASDIGNPSDWFAHTPSQEVESAQEPPARKESARPEVLALIREFADAGLQGRYAKYRGLPMMDFQKLARPRPYEEGRWSDRYIFEKPDGRQMDLCYDRGGVTITPPSREHQAEVALNVPEAEQLFTGLCYKFAQPMTDEQGEKLNECKDMLYKFISDGAGPEAASDLFDRVSAQVAEARTESEHGHIRR